MTKAQRFEKILNPMLTVGEISRLMGPGRATIQRWISKGKLKAYFLPSGHSRVHVDQLVDFLKHYDLYLPVEVLDFQRDIKAYEKDYKKARTKGFKAHEKVKTKTKRFKAYDKVKVKESEAYKKAKAKAKAKATKAKAKAKELKAYEKAKAKAKADELKAYEKAKAKAKADELKAYEKVYDKVKAKKLTRKKNAQG